MQGFLFPGRPGHPVPLTSLARVEEGGAPVQVARKNKRRIAKIFANLGAGKPLGTAVDEIIATAEAKTKFPPGYDYHFAGQYEHMTEAQALMCANEALKSAACPPTPLVPQPGGQQRFLECPVREALFEGERGAGKTSALLMDFLKDVDKGHGADWCGILFRRKYYALKDIIYKARRWIPQEFPEASYSRDSRTWTFKDGEQLILGVVER